MGIHPTAVKAFKKVGVVTALFCLGWHAVPGQTTRGCICSVRLAYYVLPRQHSTFNIFIFIDFDKI